MATNTEHDVGRISRTGQDRYTCEASDPVDGSQVSAKLQYGGVRHARVTVSTHNATADYPLQPHLRPWENAEAALREWFTMRSRTKEQRRDPNQQDG